MVIHYHWGMGIGHVYSHNLVPSHIVPPSVPSMGNTLDPTIDSQGHGQIESDPQEEDQDPDDFDPALGFDNHEDDWLDVVEEMEEDGDDRLLFEMHHMYNNH